MPEPVSGRASSLAPLSTMAWGLLLVVLDLRVDGIDLVPDPLGWLLVLVAALRLGSLHGALTVAAVAAAVGLTASLPGWIGAGGAVVTTASTVAETLLVFATCTAVMDLLPARRATANAIRWWDLGLTVVLLPFVVVAGAAPGVAALLVVVVIVAAVVVLCCFLLLLFRAARELPGSPGKTLQKIP